MDADGLPIIGPSVDYQKVEPINQKRMVTFVNHFLVHTAGFLNRFSSVCENKLAHLSTRIHRIETQMTLLEGKLSSVPGLDQVSISSSTVNQQTSSTNQQPSQQNVSANQMQTSSTNQQPSQQNVSANQMTSVPSSKSDVPTAPASSSETTAASQETVQESSPTPAPSNVGSVKQDPRYAKYFKMLTFGVPSMAVKQKMAVEGLNPNLLDTPNAPLPEDQQGMTTNPASKTDDDSDFSMEEDNQSSDDSSINFSD